MLAILAIFALPIGFISGGVAVNAVRQRNMSMAWKAGAVFGICALLFAAVPKHTPLDAHCETDWDGYANSAICD